MQIAKVTDGLLSSTTEMVPLPADMAFFSSAQVLALCLEQRNELDKLMSSIFKTLVSLAVCAIIV